MPARKSLIIFIIFIAAFVFASAASAQSTNRTQETPLLPRGIRQEEPPQSVKEMMLRLKIEKAKKDYDQMIERSEKADELSRDIEASVEKSSGFSQQDRERIAELQKITKRLLDDLGGDQSDLIKLSTIEIPQGSPAAAAKELRDAVAIMVAEVKKTTRFSISVAALESSADVLRLTQILASLPSQ